MEKRKNRRFLKYLYAELPELVSRSVLSGETAEKIRDYYGPLPPFNSSLLTTLIFSILGALLIGGGLIMIIAHNWDVFPKSFKTFFAFLPLVASQIYTGWVILKRFGDRKHLECSGIFLTLSLGTCMALIGQIYHLDSNVQRFLFYWMILIFPVIYILRSSISAILFCIIMTSYAGDLAFVTDSSMWPVLPWFVFILIFVFFSVIRKPNSPFTFLVCSAFIISTALINGFFIRWRYPFVPGFSFASLFSVLYAVSLLGPETENGADYPLEYHSFIPSGIVSASWNYPFAKLGIGGLLIVAFAYSFKGAPLYRYNYAKIMECYWIYLWLIPVFASLLYLYSKRQFTVFFICIQPLIFVVSLILSWLTGIFYLDTFIFNLYIFILGIILLYIGLKQMRVLRINQGLLIICALILFRFFESNINLIFKGIAFVIVGVAFMLVSLIASRKLKRKKQELAGSL